MRELNKISENLFEKIRDRFDDVSLGDENAKATSKPEDARFFNFDYTVDGHNHGNVTISLIDEVSLKVYFSKSITQGLSPEERQKWYTFLAELRKFAKRNMLSFEPRDITRKTLKFRDIQQVSKADSTFDKDEVVSESRLYGTSLSSYENDGPVKIIIRHKDHINPESRGARTRHISSVFVETAEGERRKLPYNNLRYARAMARHISEGGCMEDDFGQHITSIADECSKLRPFKSSMRRRTFEDDETQQMTEAAFEYHGLLNNTLKRMGGRKGYQACKEQFVATSTSYIPEDDLDIDAIRERFVKRSFNDRLEDALPLVHKAYKMKKENKFAQQFESWANEVVGEGDTYGSADGGMDGTVYENTDDSSEAVQSAIIRRIMNQHLDLLKKYGPQAILDATEHVAWSIGSVDEIGSSDVSNWVREVIEMLEHSDELDQDMDEAVGDDVVNKDVKMKRMGAKELSLKDKLKTIPQGIKSWKRGEPEDDVSLYNKTFNKVSESKQSKDNILTEIKKLSGLK